MNSNRKYVIAQGVIWAGAMLASAAASAAGSQNQFIMILILACGATMSIATQMNSLKSAGGSNLTGPNN